VSRLRILVLAPDCNPESISVNLVCYRHAEALGKLHEVTLATFGRQQEALARANGPFHAIEAIRMPLLDRIWEWSIRRIFKNNFHNRALTPFNYPFYLAFEWFVWRRLRPQIIAGEFDVVLRLSPIVTVIPSAFPFFLRNTSVPFILGPVNGGLPWPQEFSQANNQKAKIDNLRNLYRFLPFSDSTHRKAAAIIAGSSQTYAEFAADREKVFFVPENGLTLSLCSGEPRRAEGAGKLELIFVGNLVPYKACDLALRAAAPLLQRDLAHFTIVGDGPERQRLEEITKSLGIEKAVSFCGMLAHEQAMQKLRSADVLVFPSVREFGGGVVFEALAVGTVPVVADYGGPGDIIHPEIGYKVPLTTESDMACQIEKILTELVQNRNRLDVLKKQGMLYARENLTWDAKAQTVTQIMHWVLAQGPKPVLPPAKALHAKG